MPDKFISTTYAIPTIKKKRHGKQNPRRLDYRNPNDVVSLLDKYTETSNYSDFNPIIAHSFKQFEGNGLYHIRPTTNISNKFNPNSGIKIKILLIILKK